MLETLAEKIHDNRFLRLMRNMLTAGYLEDWIWNATLSGAPQGGVASPILSNIYLHRLDDFVETVLIPEYTRGEAQSTQPGLLQGVEAAARAPANAATAPQARELRRQMRSMPSADPRRSRLPAAALLPVRRRSLCSGSPDPRPRPRRSSSAGPVPA